MDKRWREFASQLCDGLIMFFPPDHSCNDAFLEADKWLQNLASSTPESSARDYVSEVSYAERRHAQTVETFQRLDDKALKFFGIAITLAGLVVTVQSAFPTTDGRAKAFGAASFVLLVVAALCALWSTLPTSVHMAWAIRTLIDSQADENTRRACLAASYECARIATTLVNNWKADKLIVAQLLVVVAMILLYGYFFFVS